MQPRNRDHDISHEDQSTPNVKPCLAGCQRFINSLKETLGLSVVSSRPAPESATCNEGFVGQTWRLKVVSPATRGGLTQENVHLAFCCLKEPSESYGLDSIWFVENQTLFDQFVSRIESTFRGIEPGDPMEIDTKQ